MLYSKTNKIRESYAVPALRRKDAIALKDAEGKEFGKE
jgi:hypothetical protein